MKYLEEFEKAAYYQQRTYGCSITLVIETARAMSLAGLSNNKIYAFCKTGLIVKSRPGGKTNIDWRPESDKKEYFDAIVEFDKITRGNA